MTVDEYGLLPEYAKRYRASVALFDRYFASMAGHGRQHHLYTIISHCEKAREHDWPEEKARALDNSAIEGASSAANSARRLATYFRSHPMQSSWAVSSAALASGIHLRKMEDTVPIEKGVPAFGPGQAYRMSEFLGTLAELLEQGEILARAGPMYHRTHHGPLVFAKPIDGRSKGKKVPDESTCLAIFLCFCLRKLSATGNIFFQRGEPMPSDGECHWDLIGQLVDDTFGQGVNGNPVDAAKRYLNRHPDIHIAGYISATDLNG